MTPLPVTPAVTQSSLPDNENSLRAERGRESLCALLSPSTAQATNTVTGSGGFWLSLGQRRCAGRLEEAKHKIQLRSSMTMAI